MSLQIVCNNIVNMKVDAIVDPTDERYSAGGGTDQAIHRAAGRGLDAACAKLKPLRAGEAAVTPGFDLDAKWVIHTVGPRWIDGTHGESAQLRDCYRNSLEQAAQYGLESIAFPLLASGTFRFPKSEAISIAMNTIRAFLEDHEMVVYLVVYDTEALRVSEERYGAIERMIGMTARAEAVCLSPEYDQQSDADRPRSKSKPIEREEIETLYTEPMFEDHDECAGDEGIDIGGLWETDLHIGGSSLEEMMKDMGDSFFDALARMIDARGMTDAQCYKKANVDKKLFNKIKNKSEYSPKKSTVIALAFALEPTREELRELLTRAGYSMVMNNAFDIIIEYCFQRKIFDVFEVNDLLFQFHQPLLGSVAKEAV